MKCLSRLWAWGGSDAVHLGLLLALLYVFLVGEAVESVRLFLMGVVSGFYAFMDCAAAICVIAGSQICFWGGWRHRFNDPAEDFADVVDDAVMAANTLDQHRPLNHQKKIGETDAKNPNRKKNPNQPVQGQS